MSYHYRPVVLIILDGWGVAPDSDGNAITRAKIPNYLNYLKNYPASLLYASGVEVGLLFGEMGNSEVGHLNIGAGRIYYQSCPRLNQEISDGSFFTNPAFLQAIEHVKKNNSTLHLMGLLSNGNVHASSEHLYALLELCERHKISKNNVAIHAFLDGRDCIYNSGKQFVAELEDKIKDIGVGQIASLCGRFYAMDRENRWERVEQAYQAIAQGKASRAAASANEAVKNSYTQKNYDEEFIPTVITRGSQPVAIVNNNDAVIFYNFRPDRARELTKAFILPGFNKFERPYFKNLFFVTMMEYEKDLPVVVAYLPIVVRNSLAEVISRAGLTQTHIAETSKYAHVTIFLNGTIETPFPGEDRTLVPSQSVASYADAPEMSALLITKEVVKALSKKKYDFIVINFANADMVGHSGNLTATIKGVETVDKCLGEIVERVLAQGGVSIITADHGNAEEEMNLQTGEIDKEHSNNPVPLIIIGKDFLGQAGPGGDAPEGDLSLKPPTGVLADVAPTVLSLLGVDKPDEMTGESLI